MDAEKIARCEGFLASQAIARKGAQAISTLIRDGWTERQTAELFQVWLQDHGVRSFFHHPFVWFGERTRFEGISRYRDYQPSSRRLLPGEVYILDVAPIYHGYISDIGYTRSLGDNPDFENCRSFLRSLRSEIPIIFMSGLSGGEIWKEIHRRILDLGYENIHQKYPFSVLGHRVYSEVTERFRVKFLHFGWQSYWALLSRGLYRQLLRPAHDGNLEGMWAIEPHLGTKELKKNFGAKFEEILVVEKERAYWLGEEFL